MTDRYEALRAELARLEVPAVEPTGTKVGAVFVDSTTLASGSRFLLSRDGLAPGLSSAAEAIDTLLEALLLYDEVCVDAIGLLQLPRAVNLASRLPNIVKAACLSNSEQATVLSDAIRRSAALRGDTAEYGLVCDEIDLPPALLGRGRWKSENLRREMLEMRGEMSEMRSAQRRRHAWAEQTTSSSPEYERYPGRLVPNHAARALYYISLCQAFGTPYVPHPARARILESAMCANPTLFDLEKLPQHEIVSEVTRSLESCAKRALEHLAPQHIALFELPPLLGALLATQAEHDDTTLDALQRMRDSPFTNAFRDWTRSISTCDDPTKVVAAWQLVEEAIERWRRDIGEGVHYRRRSISVGGSFGLVQTDVLSPTVKDPILMRLRRWDKVLYFLHSISFRRAL